MRSPPTSAAGLAKAKLSLTDESVAKVVPRGVTHLDMAPYDPDGPLLVAAGDKDGNIGLWRVDNEDASVSKEDGDGSEDGVLFYKPHGSYVCHLKWGRGGLGGKLITAAYDGVVRALDVQGGEQCFKELFATDDEDEFSGCDVSADGRTIHLVDNHGNYHVVDARSGKLASAAVQLHEKKINTVHLEPGAERTIATSCGDQTVCVWDVRKTGKGAKPLSSPALQVLPGGVFLSGREGGASSRRATTICCACGVPRAARSTRTRNPRSKSSTTTRPGGGCCRSVRCGRRALTVPWSAP